MKERVCSFISGKAAMLFGRSADMFWITFSKADVAFGKKQGEYCMNILAPFRVLDDGIILLGNYDMYIQAEVNDTIRYANKRDESLFDRKVNVLNSLLPLNVKSINIYDYGDIRIELDRKIIIEVFIAGNTSTEYWRTFECGNTQSHLVYSRER